MSSTIATETGRALGANALPDRLFISVVTIAELRAGVASPAGTWRPRLRLATAAIAGLEALPIDVMAAGHWGLCASDSLRRPPYQCGRLVDCRSGCSGQ